MKANLESTIGANQGWGNTLSKTNQIAGDFGSEGRLNRQNAGVLFLALTALSLIPITACMPRDPNLVYYRFIGIYDPTPSNDIPYTFSGDEFQEYVTEGFPQGTDPNKYNCSETAWTARRGVGLIYARIEGKLVPGSCTRMKLE